MNIAEQLSSTIRRELPDALITIDEPGRHDGFWWIDVKRGTRSATVEWRPKQGFGVGLGAAAYGEGPDVIAPTIEAAARHVVEYLRDDATPESAAARHVVGRGSR